MNKVRGRDKILGATIVAAHTAEMISEMTLAMIGGLNLRAIARTIQPYPTQAEAIKNVAVPSVDQHGQANHFCDTHLTNSVSRLRL